MAGLPPRARSFISLVSTSPGPASNEPRPCLTEDEDRGLPSRGTRRVASGGSGLLRVGDEARHVLRDRAPGRGRTGRVDALVDRRARRLISGEWNAPATGSRSRGSSAPWRATRLARSLQPSRRSPPAPGSSRSPPRIVVSRTSSQSDEASRSRRRAAPSSLRDAPPRRAASRRPDRPGSRASARGTTSAATSAAN